MGSFSPAGFMILQAGRDNKGGKGSKAMPTRDPEIIFFYTRHERAGNKDTKLRAQELGPRQVLLGKAHKKASKKPRTT